MIDTISARAEGTNSKFDIVICFYEHKTRIIEWEKGNSFFWKNNFPISLHYY